MPGAKAEKFSDFFFNLKEDFPFYKRALLMTNGLGLTFPKMSTYLLERTMFESLANIADGGIL
jgi:hypothetical protein